jgi:hypothetical protein
MASFLNKIFGCKNANSRKALIASLEGVDLRAAAEIISFAFREAAKKAESEGGYSIMKKEFITAAERFIENPCIESAITLLEEYPSFAGLFEATKDPLQIWARDFKKKHDH